MKRIDERLKLAIRTAIEEEKKPRKEAVISIRLPHEVNSRLAVLAKRRELGAASLARALIIAGLDVLDDR